MLSVMRLGSRAVCCLLAAIGLPAGVCHAGDRPNILWLMAEDTSASSLPCYRNTLASTPTLDALASRSIVFERCLRTLPDKPGLRSSRLAHSRHGTVLGS